MEGGLSQNRAYTTSGAIHRTFDTILSSLQPSKIFLNPIFYSGSGWPASFYAHAKIRSAGDMSRYSPLVSCLPFIDPRTLA